MGINDDVGIYDGGPVVEKTLGATVGVMLKR